MPKTKKYMVIAKDGVHEYDLLVEPVKRGNKFSLLLSGGEQWIAKGELVLSMTNTGSGVKFDRSLKKIDYAMLLYIRILVSFEHQTDENPLNREKYRIIEDKAVIKV
jgi:hypothetical protein